MKILLNHITTDSNLKKGVQVCYKDINGAFTKLGVITDVMDQMFPILYLINTSMGAYTADELKLIAPKCLNSVQVHFKDSVLDYETNVSSETTTETANQYFTGKYFNMGRYPAENMQKCIGITFTDNN